jgi:4-alpha-glucanotransferase
MPTYHWGNIAQDGYRYLREKLRYASNFYDILRVDHVVGLFRIWSIPSSEPIENQGLNGFFDPTDEGLWEDHGKRILAAMLDSSEMLLCAEDLGTVPPVCRKVLTEYGIPGNDVQRWTKDWDVKHDFLDPHEYRAVSVSMLSTHDSTNWPAWWENEAGTVDEDLFRRKCNEHGIDFNSVKAELFNDQLSRHGRLRWKETVSSPETLTTILQKPPDEIWDILHLYKNSFQEKEKLWKHLGFSGEIKEKANREMVRRVLEVTLKARSVYCINLLTDWLFLTDTFKGDPYQYRINTPGVIGTRNWSLVLPLSLEDLLASDLCRKMKGMVESSSRI